MIGIDIKNGQFVVYPSGEVLTSLEGKITKSYYRKVGEKYQLKVCFEKDGQEYTLNCIAGNVTYQSLVTTLIENTEDMNISIERKNNGMQDYYLIKNNKILI